MDHSVSPFSYHALGKPLFRVTHITGDKITLGRDGARRHEEHIAWGKVHEARAVRFTVGPFGAPAYIHVLLVDKDASGAFEQWYPLAGEEGALALQASGIAGQMPCLSDDAMTGNNDGQRVVPQRLRHSPHRLWLSQGRGNTLITHHCT